MRLISKIAFVLFLFSHSHQEQRLIAAPVVEWMSVNKIRPGQLVIGAAEASIRASALEGMTPTERQKFLEKHSISVVRGPKGRVHLVDGHHLSFALMSLESRGVLAARAPAQIIGDLSGETEDNFWKTMQERNWVYLFDENDVAIRPSDLPLQLKKLKDDRYRSLAWLLREEGCFKDLERPFQEFAWAHFLRKSVPLPDNQAKSVTSALLEAKKLAHGPDASRLPGYLKNHPSSAHSELSAKNQHRISTLGSALMQTSDQR